MISTLRRRVLDGETVLGTFLLLGSPAAAEVIARAGFDWLVVDLEHGVVGDDHLLPMLHALSGSGVTPLVRVEAAARPRIARVLDLGAQGVVVPQVRDAGEAAEIVSWMRYPPAGQRGLALFTRGMGLGGRTHADAATRHEELLGIVQVETPGAVAQASAMAAIDGVDVLFVGPTDLSHALGVPGRLDDPAYESAVRSVADAARAHGKAAGVMIWTPEDATRYLRMGYTVIAISTDGSILDRAMRRALDDTRATVAAADA